MATETASKWESLPGPLVRDIVVRVKAGYDKDIANIRRTCKHWLVETGSGRDFLCVSKVHPSWDSPILTGLKFMSVRYSYYCRLISRIVVSRNIQSPETPVGPSVFRGLEELSLCAPPARNNVHQILNALVPHGRIRSIDLDRVPFVAESHLSILGLLTSLTKLTLSDAAQFTDSTADALASLTNLTSLSIGRFSSKDTLLTDKGVAALCGLTGLTTLELLTSGEGLTLAMVPFVSALTGLKTLELRVPDTEDLEVTDMVSTLGRLVRLEYLRLLYPVNVCLGVSALTGLPALKKLEIVTVTIVCVDNDWVIHNPLARLAGFPVLEYLVVDHYDDNVNIYMEDFIRNYRFSVGDDGELPVVMFKRRCYPHYY